MTYDFDSIAECTSAPAIAQLGGKRCTNFPPLLPKFYIDAEGEELVGCPDFLITRPRCFTFIDTKSGKLNFHYTRASSREALADVYTQYFRRPAGDMTYHALSSALYNSPGKSGFLATLAHGFNHSVWKLAALQAKHGFQRFLVVFKQAPSKREAKRYIDADLIFCTVKTLPDLMNSIELLQHGWHIPFVFTGPGYSFTVSADSLSRGLTPEAVEASDRAKFLAAVAADELATAAKPAQDDADWAAGIRPY